MKKTVRALFVVVSCCAMMIALDHAHSGGLDTQGPTVDMAPGETKDFTEVFTESRHTAYSLSLLGTTGTHGHLFQVTLNSWHQTGSLITVDITLHLSLSAPPGSQLSFGIQYRYYFVGGYATVTSYWTVNVISTLPPPQIAVSPTACYEYVAPGDSIEVKLVLENTAPQGSADLVWQANAVLGTFGDLIAQYDVSALTGSDRCVGVEYAFGHPWVTSSADGGGPPNQLSKIDVSGPSPVLVSSYDQGTTSSWGWRDLASDGTYLYASDAEVIQQIDPTTGSFTGTTIPGPVNPNRAIAYDPATDHFWTMNFSSSLYEIDRNGNIINTFANPISSYGAGWDSWTASGPFLWVSSGTTQGATYKIHQVNPADGTLTGLQLTGTANAIAGGLDIEGQLIPGKLVAVALGQISPDVVDVWDITPSRKFARLLPPTSGRIPPGNTSQLTMRLFGLQPDTTFAGNVAITSNDPEYPEVTIPVSVNTTVGIAESEEFPTTFAMGCNYPNPFNPTTTITYHLPRMSDVTMVIYNLLGQQIRMLVDEQQGPGRYRVQWDGYSESGRRVGSGIYICHMTAGNFTGVRKMTLLR